MEAILFGHEKGAFTGAAKAHAGKFEQANGGTLLLDEITEMDLGLQAKILRVIQEREVERLGGNETITLNVRVLATTNRDLRQTVSAGKFREDLFYRLNVFPLHIAPLRARTDDIVPLAKMIISRLHDRRSSLPTLSDCAVTALLNHAWPGNVREFGEYDPAQSHPVGGRHHHRCRPDFRSDIFYDVSGDKQWALSSRTTFAKANSNSIAEALRDGGGNKAATASPARYKPPYVALQTSPYA